MGLRGQNAPPGVFPSHPAAASATLHRPGKGYTDKLLAKTHTIQQHADAAARACGTTEHRNWKAIPLFVTRAVEPAAFTAAPRVAFTVPEHLTAVLTHADDPLPGYVPYGPEEE
jgi:hypothetical protein